MPPPKKPDYQPAPNPPGSREREEAVDKRARDERDDAERGRDERLHEEHRDAPYANRDQDPGHPANTTQARDLNAPTTFSIPPEDMMTEQEKLAAGAPDDATAGVGPFNPAEHTTGPVETIADQGIGPRTPYPTGNPPPPDESVTRSQGIKGASDRPHREPGEDRGPTGPQGIGGPTGTYREDAPANPGPFDPPRQHKVPSP